MAYGYSYGYGYGGTMRRGAAAPAWSPLDLGDALYAWWDAEHADSLTLSGASVTSWTDRVGGYAATQGTSGARPKLIPFGFNGGPGVLFDGVDDCLTLAPVPAGIPTGEAPCEIWALVDQTVFATAAGQRQIASYGSGTMDRRVIYRDLVSGENRFRMVGTRSTNGVVATEGTVPFFSRHIVRGIFNGTQIIAEIDGVQGSPTALVPLTTDARLRLGASPLSSANAFFQGVMSMVAITGVLDSDQASAMRDYMAARRDRVPPPGFEMIVNGDFASGGPPPVMSGNIPPMISSGQLVFDQDVGDSGTASWVAPIALTPGDYVINLANPQGFGPYTIRIGGSAVGTGGTTQSYSGAQVDTVLNVPTVNGQIIEIYDPGNANIIDNFSVKRA